jgi:hypothetical protein
MPFEIEIGGVRVAGFLTKSRQLGGDHRVEMTHIPTKDETDDPGGNSSRRRRQSR